MNRTESAAPVDSVFSARRFALALALLMAACFLPVLFGFQSFIFRDFGLFGHPLAQYHRDAFWRGEIPLWNPLNNCGLPFLAQWNTLVFYPGSLIYLLLPLPWSLNLFCLLHLYFGGLGMYFLARRWTGSNFAAAFAGVVFSFNGLALHCLMWPNNIAALGWMPWVLLVVERAWTRGGWALLPAVLVGACQFLTGAPEAFLLTWVVAAAIWFAHAIANRAEFLKSLGRFAAVVAGVIAFTAVQWLPLLELIRQSQRSATYDTGGWAMPAWGWANLLVPMFRSVVSITGVTFQIGQAWTSSYYFGVVTIWLALVAVIRLRNAKVWTLAALVVVGLVLALGDSGFVWPWLKDNVGALGFMRFPVKLVLLVVAPLTLLAALGAAEVFRATADAASSGEPRVRRDVWVMAAALLVAIGIVLWFAAQKPIAEQNTSAALRNGVARAVFFACLAAGVWLWRKVSPRRANLAAVAWLLLVAADFLTHMPWQNPTVSPLLLAPKLNELQELRQAATPGVARAMPSFAVVQYFSRTPVTTLENSYLARRMAQSHNLNLLEGIAKPDGFFSLYLARQHEVLVRLFEDERIVREPLADVMAIARMTAPEKLFEWNARSNVLPFISAGQQPVFVPENEILNALLRTNFNPHAMVLLPSNVQPQITAAARPDAKISLENFRAQQVRFKVTAGGPAIVYVSQSFYTPWKAYVDNAPVPLWRANHAFQALQVPGGEHHVELRYEDGKFRAGAIISGTLALLALITTLVFPNSRRAFTGQTT